jgi:hypothetical protein
MRISFTHFATSTVFLALFGACTETGTSTADESEIPLVLLASEYSVDVRLLGYDCPLGHISPNGFRGVAQVEQVGNTVVWRQQALNTDGEADTRRAWVLSGRVCDEGGAPVLRLRGGRVARIAEGGGFCRADLRIPAAHAICPVEVDVCSDPSTIALYIDPCSDRLVASFRSCMVYTESCLGQDACRFAMEWEATSTNASGASTLNEQDACTALDIPPAPSGCTNECSVCGC